MKIAMLPAALALALCVPAWAGESVVGDGWANNSVNAVIFRKNSLVSHAGYQYIAYYDNTRHVVLGKRKLGASRWTLAVTPYTGNAADAHNAISIMVDGLGYLHVAWDHHNNPLHYARGVQPGSITLGQPQGMTGDGEGTLSYPEFHRLADGKLLFLYRDGASGKGNLVINRYDTASGQWHRLHSNLISGEGQRSAYWQVHVDHLGTVHLSWVWRESPDVASNHDMAYARSRDGGQTWERSDGQAYALPVTADSAEYALRIPQNSELINQTSMAADRQGRPYIASYWRDAGTSVPQYHVIYRDDQGWRTLALDFRHTAFSLSGAGTKRIPISRPQLLIDTRSARPSGALVFRDEERGSRVSVARIADFRQGRWTLQDLSQDNLGSWEPSYDTELWRTRGWLDLFVQAVQQVDGEGQADVPPTKVKVLRWEPKF